jgi:hypothetical protein
MSNLHPGAPAKGVKAIQTPWGLSGPAPCSQSVTEAVKNTLAKVQYRIASNDATWRIQEIIKKCAVKKKIDA